MRNGELQLSRDWEYWTDDERDVLRREYVNGTSNASVIHMPKPPISASVEMGDFCLLRLCPNPRRTLVRVLETLENSSGYEILQIA